MLVGSVSGHRSSITFIPLSWAFRMIDEVVIGPEAWVNTVEINHIVACQSNRRRKAD